MSVGRRVDAEAVEISRMAIWVVKEAKNFTRARPMPDAPPDGGYLLIVAMLVVGARTNQ